MRSDRLPIAVVEALGPEEGDEIKISAAGARHFDTARKPQHEELLKRLRAFRGRLPDDFRSGRDEANIDTRSKQFRPALSRVLAIATGSPYLTFVLPSQT